MPPRAPSSTLFPYTTLFRSGLSSVQEPPPLKLPAAPGVEPAPSRLKLTVPLGADAVPASASVTVAVQVLAGRRERGLSHATMVVVIRSWSAIVKLPVLLACS